MVDVCMSAFVARKAHAACVRVRALDCLHASVLLDLGELEVHTTASIVVEGGALLLNALTFCSSELLRLWLARKRHGARVREWAVLRLFTSSLQRLRENNFGSVGLQLLLRALLLDALTLRRIPHDGVLRASHRDLAVVRVGAVERDRRLTTDKLFKLNGRSSRLDRGGRALGL